MTEETIKEETKKCPYCAETIKAEATVCRYCGRDLSGAAPQTVVVQQPKKPNTSGTLVGLIVVVCLVACALMWIVPEITSKLSPPTPTERPEVSAWYACAQFVERQLGVSAGDAQRYTASGVTSQGTGKYTVVVFYAKLGSTYRCGLTHNSNGDWQLTSLDAK